MFGFLFQAFLITTAIFIVINGLKLYKSHRIKMAKIKDLEVEYYALLERKAQLLVSV